jgi:hypothetical protein
MTATVQERANAAEKARYILEDLAPLTEGLKLWVDATTKVYPENLLTELVDGEDDPRLHYAKLRETLNPIPSSALAGDFARMKMLLDSFDEVRKPLAEAVETMKQATIPCAFKLEGLTSQNTNYGRVTITHRTYASIKAETKDAALDWLRANDLGDIITEQVNAATLGKTAQTLQQDTGKSLDPDLFSVYVQLNTSFTKKK